MTQVSVFKNKTEVNNSYTQNAIDVLSRFKEDRNGIQEKRGLAKNEFDKFKTELPIVCFGGVFNKRSKNNLKKASGLMVLDFDDVKDLKAKKEELKALPYMYSVFISPSGRGLKAVARISHVQNDKIFKNYYRGLQTRLNGLDESGKDISRACFFSYDPDIYINEEAEVFTDYIEEEAKTISKKKLKANDYQTAGRVLRIIQNAFEGERHDKILKASRLMGGYVEAGRVSYDEAVRLLEQEAYNIDPKDFYSNKRAVYDGLEDGMKNPLKDLNYEVEKEEKEIELGKIYYTLKDVEDEIEDLWSNGHQRGYEVGFDNSKISIKSGCTTYIYAAPYSGKTQVWFEILVNLSFKYGLRHAIFSPESGGSAEIFVELIEIVARSDFYNTYKNKMSAHEKDQAKKFVDAHFIAIDPDDGILTPEDFYIYVDVIERVYNVKIDTVTADPWNEFKHDFSQDNNRQDMYIERQLGFIRKNAKKNDRHNCIITHVQDQNKIKDENIGWYYPIPSFREIAGGQAWSRKGQQMLAVWRPPLGFMDEHGYPYEPNTTLIHVQKSKPKGIGETGIMVWQYDIKKHSYYITKNGEKQYSDRKQIEDNKEDFFDIPEQIDIFKTVDTLNEFEEIDKDQIPF